MTEQTATDRVRNALSARQAPTRKDVEHSFRDAWGVSARRAKALASTLAPVLGAVDDGTDELVERMKRLEKLIGV